MRPGPPVPFGAVSSRVVACLQVLAFRCLLPYAWRNANAIRKGLLMDAAAENRMPVAMRLPRSEVEAVAAYARENRITKTDAFLHFLRLGLNSDRETRDDARLAEIERLLEEVLDKVSEPRGLDPWVVNEAIREEARKFPAICKVILFGSFARGDATSKSDIDLRLVLDRSFPFSLYDLARFQKSLAKATGREVDAVTSDVIKNENLARAIESEGVVIYER